MSEGVGTKKVLIVGGGFGGIATGQVLENYSGDNLDITLVSKLSHFEYHSALYRVVAGSSPLEVCIPLSSIFKGRKIKLVEDEIVEIDKKNKTASGSSGSKYSWDILVLSNGSKTSFFDIPGLEKHSLTLKSMNDALKIKRHLHESFAQARDSKSSEPIHIVIAGGGPTGVELSGELAVYTKKLAKNYQLNPSQIIIELFEASPRLLPTLEPWASELAEKRLKRLGVYVYLSSPIEKNDIEQVYLPKMAVKSNLVIWTAGVCAQELTKKVAGDSHDKGGRIEVDEQLRMKDVDSIFVIGDSASTKYSGLAQTAVDNGQFVGKQIIKIARGGDGRDIKYSPSPGVHAIPIGPGWAIVSSGRIQLSGRIGWSVRRLADLNYFLAILHPSAAWRAYRDGRKIFESCPECAKLEAKR